MKANENSRIALFTGTFDPFTTGHASVVRRALPLFDHLVIAVAVSERKHTQEEISERVAAIASLYEDDPRVSVRPYSDLTIDMARREGHASSSVVCAMSKILSMSANRPTSIAN